MIETTVCLLLLTLGSSILSSYLWKRLQKREPELFNELVKYNSYWLEITRYK